MKFAKRLEHIKPSPTLALNARAKKMQAEGISVVNLTCGEPDFNTPDNVGRAGIEAINSGFTKYTAVSGINELKDAVIKYLERDQNLKYKREEIIITPGAKYAIYAAMQAILDPGDEVIIPAPYWVSYSDQVMLFDGKPVVVNTTDKSGFKMTPDQLKSAITSKSKILILNSPCNPTGAAYSEDELKAIAKICVENNLWVISDEIYDRIVFDGFICKSIARCENMRNQTIVVNGVSKSYAMTGWRMGFAAACADLIKKIEIIQGQAMTSVASITQKACVEAYDGPQEYLGKMVKAFSERRDFIVPALNKIPGFKCLKPAGTFYALPNVEELIGKTFKGKKISSSADLSEYLLSEARVATVPGEAFGAPGYIRLSYATSMEEIKEGIKRIEAALK